jgi:hypothetical protein
MDENMKNMFATIYQRKHVWQLYNAFKGLENFAKLIQGSCF